MPAVPLSLQIDPDVWAVTVIPPEDDTNPFTIVVSPHETSACPQCRQMTYVRVRTTFPVADLPYGDHPVLLRYSPASRQCACGYSELLDIPGICRSNRGIGWTSTLQRYLAKHPRDTVDELRRRTGLPNSRIQALRRPVEPGPTIPESIGVLGIDELYVDRRRFAVVTDITSRRLLRFVPIATTMDGLSDRISIEGLLRELPRPDTVTLDMNPAVLQAVRYVWAGMNVVIDKRHALRTADRAFAFLIGTVLNQRLDRAPDATGPFFGEAAFHRHRLMHLVTKRSASCTPIDLAQWALLREEEPQLWKAYTFRERFYDLFGEHHAAHHFKRNLDDWQQEVRNWLQTFDATTKSRPLTASLMMMTEFKDSLAQYVEGRATNAFTEAVNARLRAHVRRGRRYRPETLIALVNQELQVPVVGNRIAPATTAWHAWQEVRPDVPLTDLPHPTVEATGETEGAPTGASGLDVPEGSAPVLATAPRRGRRVQAHPQWPPQVQAWLTAGPTRTRARLETRLASGAPADDRLAWLTALRTRTADQPLPSGLERHVLLEYLRAQPGYGLEESAADLRTFLIHPEQLPELARPHMTALARAAINADTDPAGWTAVRQSFRRYAHLRDSNRIKNPDLILQEVDRLRQQLTRLPSYGRVHSRLLRIDSTHVPTLLAHREFCWAVAAWPLEAGNIHSLEDLSKTILAIYEQNEIQCKNKTRFTEKVRPKRQKP